MQKEQQPDNIPDIDATRLQADSSFASQIGALPQTTREFLRFVRATRHPQSLATRSHEGEANQSVAARATVTAPTRDAIAPAPELGRVLGAPFSRTPFAKLPAA